jgi:hypothetical protein
VYFFPFYHYLDFKFDVKSELIKYINGDKCERYECGLQANNPPMNVVLLWNYKYFSDSETGLQMLVAIKASVRHPVTYLGYNWDPVPPKKEIAPLKLLFIRTLNAYLSCDGRELKYLIDRGIYNYVYCPSGFDPRVTYYTNDPSYKCDVSIICTNLYGDNSLFTREGVRVHRKELVDLLYQHRTEMQFHIYGPPQFKETYPDCYRGSIAYENCPKVFSNSKINLCLHATSFNNYQKYIYFSERLPQIMGSRGLLYCDTEYDYLLIPNVNYILADASDPLGQIRNILKNYDTGRYQSIKDKGYELAQKSLTWDVMRQRINLVTHLRNQTQTQKK